MPAVLIKVLTHFFEDLLALWLVDDTQVFEQPVIMRPCLLLLHQFFTKKLFVHHYILWNQLQVLHLYMNNVLPFLDQANGFVISLESFNVNLLTFHIVFQELPQYFFASLCVYLVSFITEKLDTWLYFHVAQSLIKSTAESITSHELFFHSVEDS